MTRHGGLYEVVLVACRIEVGYPSVHPADGSLLAVHLANQQVTEAEAETVSRRLRDDGHPVVLIPTQHGFARAPVELSVI